MDLTRALRQLPVGRRQAIVMHHPLGLPVPDIADAPHVAPGTVKSRLGRARDALAGLPREETHHG